VFRLLQALALGDGKTVVETSQALRTHGLSAASTLEEMSAVLQRMAVLQAVPAAGAVDDDPDAADIARLAGLMPADETQLLYSICLHGRAELGLAPDEYAALTMVLLRLLAFKPKADGSPQTEKKTLKAASAPAPEVVRPVSPPAVAVVSAPRVASDKQAAQHQYMEPKTADAVVAVDLPAGQRLPVRDMGAAPGSAPRLDKKDEQNVPLAQVNKAHVTTKIEAVQVHVQPDSLREVASEQVGSVVLSSPDGDFWFATVTALIAAESITAMVRELALQSQLVARDSDQWLLRVERESLNQPGSRDRLAAALAAAGHPVKLVAEVGRVSDSPARRNAAAAAEAQLMAEKIIFDDPMVQSLMRDFGAKIVPGSIKPVAVKVPG
jgi:DNA polymerase-3 subunit gamma/tau